MKILVIDDHVLIREALQRVLKKLRPDATILEASNGGQARRLVEEHSDLELILLDLNLPDADGFHLLTDLRASYPAVSIVVLSAGNERDNVVRALDLGALGFIPKSAPRAVMLSALQLVFSGGIYIPPEILGHRELQPPQAPQRSAGDRLDVKSTDIGLTERQVEVLALMMRGKSNKAICRVLELAEPTVKNHVAAILKALKVSNRTEAVIAASELGWQFPRGDKS